MQKNPHVSNSPEWHLYVKWLSQRHLINAIQDDIERAQERISDAIKQEEAYAIALEKLTGAKP